MVAGRCWAGAADVAGLLAMDAPGAADRGGGTGAAGAVAKAGAALGAPVGPPGGNVGNLIVGAAVGFGGKLMRTVSFLGCTLPVSFFGGGTAPVGPDGGMDGGLSAIVYCLVKDKRRHASVKWIKQKTGAARRAVRLTIG